MISSFGAILMIDYKILENIATPIIILVFTLILTVVISRIWKKFKIQPVNSNSK